METLLEANGNISTSKKVFIPKETPDHPFDVTLVVEDGKEFKAHRRVLSEASPFFEKLLNSDMRESNEGVIRLEMITELCFGLVLEFIYTGGVEITADDNARDLIVMADYLVLPHLKTLAERFLLKNLKLDVSNSFTYYFFAERYRCGELISHAISFISANITTAAKAEEFLKLSSEAVKMCISSDELNVSTEEDVFKIILTWIDHDKSEREKYFTELFREVRLVFVSRDFLQSDIVTNDLVRNDNQGCMDRVKDAMKYSFIGPISSPHFRFKARNSLETCVFVVTLPGQNYHWCYNTRENTWSQTKFEGREPLPHAHGAQVSEVIYSHDNFYLVSKSHITKRYDSDFKSWEPILSPTERRQVHSIFAGYGDEIYALMSQCSCIVPKCVPSEESDNCSGTIYSPCGKMHSSFLTKFAAKTNSWEDITSFDLDLRRGICIVAEDSFVYFLGGHVDHRHETLTDADRYDVSTNTWAKLADLQEPRRGAQGAAANGKIFIIDGGRTGMSSCEVYSETTNEWHYIASLISLPKACYARALFSANGKLYVLRTIDLIRESREYGIRIDCYDPDSNLWTKLDQLPPRLLVWPEASRFFAAPEFCSMKVFNGCDFLQESLSSYLKWINKQSRCRNNVEQPPLDGPEGCNSPEATSSLDSIVCKCECSLV